jgi:hypothetical protein
VGGIAALQELHDVLGEMLVKLAARQRERSGLGLTGPARGDA